MKFWKFNINAFNKTGEIKFILNLASTLGKFIPIDGIGLTHILMKTHHFGINISHSWGKILSVSILYKMANPNGSALSLLEEGFGGMKRVGLWPVSEFLNRILVQQCSTSVLSDTVLKPIH